MGWDERYWDGIGLGDMMRQSGKLRIGTDRTGEGLGWGLELGLSSAGVGLGFGLGFVWVWV